MVLTIDHPNGKVRSFTKEGRILYLKGRYLIVGLWGVGGYSTSSHNLIKTSDYR